MPISHSTLGLQAFECPDYKTLALMVELVRCRSLTVAATRCGLRPGAASKLLQKARERLDDALFVRSGGRMIPTPTMLALEPRATQIVRLSESLRPAAAVFEPEHCRDVVRIATTDNVSALLIAPLFATLRRRAPGLVLDVRQLEDGTLARLREGEIDLAIFMDEDYVDQPSFHRQTLLNGRHVALVRAGHPLALLARVRAPGPEDAAPFPRINVTMKKPSGGDYRAIFPQLEASHPAAMHLPTILAAAFALEKSDAILLAPAPLAAKLVAVSSLAAFEDPDRATPLPWRPQLVWHERTAACPLQQWLRSLLVMEAQTLDDA